MTGFVKYSPSPFPLLPGRRGELRGPASLAVRCGHMSESQIMVCEQVGCIACPGWAPNSLSHSLSHLTADGEKGGERGCWAVMECKPWRRGASSVRAAGITLNPCPKELKKKMFENNPGHQELSRGI